MNIQNVEEKPLHLILLLLFLLLPFSFAVASDQTSLEWQQYNAAAFTKAQAQEKLLLLDLVAVWCHWCHVMDATTYQDPEVKALIERHFIPVKADHDARPDLAERYREYGWPATIVIAPDGTEIVKRAGYIEPASMARLLRAILDDPSAEDAAVKIPDQFVDSPVITETLRNELKTRHKNRYDVKLGGLDLAQKFIDADALDWGMALAAQGDSTEAYRVKQTLDAAMNLIDPEFGGAYQYSTHGDWDHPHYEKIMTTQNRYLRVYAQAYSQFEEPRYQKAAAQIADYLLEFLSAPKGGFYTSQDADLKQGKKAHDYFRLARKERLNLGLPRIDKHRYAAENGLAVEGLARLYEATGNTRYLNAAVAAAQWVLKNRAYYGGGFRHDQIDKAGPYLNDTLYMGRAFLALYEATDNPLWLTRARQAAEFLNQYFRHPAAGVVSATDNGTPVKPLPQIDQNISTARFLLALADQLKNPEPQLDLATHVIRFLLTEEIALSRPTDAGILLVSEHYAALTTD
ncbi:MAG: DUF255 domain-containing protein [Thiotrichales bacterium]